ncbi:Histidine kinase-, DNA gyrase B-, and HSP90-like ATPase [Micromonospora sediminicola]|uniref:Histidine kinase-, DNA gyrase B-, and HSP90-like ATPase n=1 Tax=Micromonospora sediminicola TaxID=946078 RepID=A0A1A9BHV4_9ACTN|nr:ATP-binding protein [Micromonospora sediminicola]SBT68539.1 Histidine kinase-, DNA gyrase B-, and HSP90-like ATPase [Micromonospora sediminicola]
MTEWVADVPTDGSIDLPPDPRALDAIGRNHSLETALADLVDNSVDAGATNVVIRVVVADGLPRVLYVADNGRGMAPDAIDTAMTVGGRRDYENSDLGHFGLGLKAASFSQARSLTVMSRAAGHDPVGRRWRVNTATKRDFSCDVVPAPFVTAEFDQDWRISLDESGTIIRWDDVVTFPAGSEAHRVEIFIDRLITGACQHLGIVFHRFLEQERLSVDFEVYDVDEAYLGPPIPVTPLNPFAYSRPGAEGYPRTLTATVDGVDISFKCHIWPGKSSTPSYRLRGTPVDYQGLYFYRRDRLLQFGGWEGIHVAHAKLQLARVEVDIDGDVAGMFHMNAEKSRVLVGLEFSRLAAAARSSDGTSFNDYFDLAEQVYRTANARSMKRTPMIHPGSGLPSTVKDVIRKEVPPIVGRDPIEIRWATFVDDSFFRVDREQSTLWLNKRYRKMLLGGKHGGLNDLPLVKSLLYLLVADSFEGNYHGARDKDNIELWQSVLTTAVQAERR